jgi:predicted enzyme related to lactoylglutathione lyase
MIKAIETTNFFISFPYARPILGFVTEPMKREVMKDVTEEIGMGWHSLIRDPSGAVLGLWQPKIE